MIEIPTSSCCLHNLGVRTYSDPWISTLGRILGALREALSAITKDKFAAECYPWKTSRTDSRRLWCETCASSHFSSSEI